jgi:NTE family protein
MKRALVLGGGGLYGIAWESGVLAGLAQAGVDVTAADLIIGTSAGSQVGAVVASGLAWEEIWARQVAPLPQSQSGSGADMPALFRLYARIQADAKTPQEWILGQGALAREAVTVSEAERLGEIEGRIQMSAWPERLGVIGVETLSGKRVLWTKESGVDLISAVAASSALPGVYPAITIGEHRYCDGGVYSMENADLAQGYAKVLILCAGLPIPTPYTLDQQVESLRRSGAEVEVILPDQGVLSVLRQMGGSPVNPELRAPVAQEAKKQGLSLSKKLASFWNDNGSG